jgi:hypothetical protein
MGEVLAHAATDRQDFVDCGLHLRHAGFILELAADESKDALHVFGDIFVGERMSHPEEPAQRFAERTWTLGLRKSYSVWPPDESCNRNSRKVAALAGSSVSGVCSTSDSAVITSALRGRIHRQRVHLIAVEIRPLRARRRRICLSANCAQCWRGPDHGRIRTSLCDS